MGGRQNPRARSSLHDERFFEPAFGVVHRVQPSEELEHFFDDLSARFAELEPLQFFDDSGVLTSERAQVKLFHPGRLSLRIVERRLTNGYAKRNRFHWKPADKARIEQEIVDQIGRYHLGGRVINAAMGEVARLGDPDTAREKQGRVLALTPESDSLEADFFATEHEIAVNGISESLKRFRTTAPYLPHISIGRIHREATPKQATDIMGMVKEHLPLEVNLNPIQFISS